MERKKKILHIAYGFDGGGVGQVIANYCTRRPFHNIHFDVIGFYYGRNHFLHQQLEDAGFGIHYVTPKEQLLKHIRDVWQIIRKGQYDAVHVHMEEWSFLYLAMAKLCRVPVRICHAHLANVTQGKKKLYYRFFRFLLNHLSTLRLACSSDAGKYLYHDHPFTVLHNAIDPDCFRFSSQIREQVRKEMSLEDKWVIGNVGRFSYQKNPKFCIDTFYQIYKQRPNAVLMMIGMGEQYQDIYQYAHALGLKDQVIFLGRRNDVPRLMQAMDVFFLPSRYEGLGIVYVEAQASGLITFGTDNRVPRDAEISDDLMHFLPDTFIAEEWAEAILRVSDYQRQDTSELIRAKGYDINTQINTLEQLYLNALEACE